MSTMDGRDTVPAALVTPSGVHSSRLYYRSALARVGLEAEAVAFREFKSAHEPYTRDDRGCQWLCG